MYIGKAEREKYATCWFSLQMPTGTGSSQTLELGFNGVQGRSPTHVRSRDPVTCTITRMCISRMLEWGTNPGLERRCYNNVECGHSQAAAFVVVAVIYFYFYY